jgi:hypothetical protein
LGLWDVLENCERKGSLDVHIKIKKKMIFNLYSRVSSHSKIILTEKKVIGISLKNWTNRRHHLLRDAFNNNTMSFENKVKIWSTLWLT